MAASMAENLIGGANQFMKKDEKAEGETDRTAQAVEKAEIKGIRRMVMALLESGVDYQQCVDMLKKYWEFPDSDARETVSYLQTVDLPVAKLKEYLQSEGWTEEQVTALVKSSGLRKKLKQDATHSLWKLSPKELYETIA